MQIRAMRNRASRGMTVPAQMYIVRTSKYLEFHDEMITNNKLL